MCLEEGYTFSTCYSEIHITFINIVTVMLIFAMSFKLMMTYGVLSLLGRSQMDLLCHVCFWVTNAHMCAKMISSWVRKVLGVSVVHMSSSTL